MHRSDLSGIYWMPTLASVILSLPTDFGKGMMTWLLCPISSRKGRLLGTIAAHHRLINFPLVS
jgi:hypothetical protein